MLLPKSFGLVAQFCTKVSKAFLPKIIALLRYLFDNFFKLITIFLIVIVIVHIIGRSDDKIVSLEPITVPLEYIEKYGISEQSLTNLLINKLRLIDTKVSTRRAGYEFAFASSVEESELTFKYQDISIPLSLLYSLLIKPKAIINGSVIEYGGKIWVVIRIVGKPYKSFCLSKEKFKDIEKNCTESATKIATKIATEITTEIAEYCYEQIDLYRMALYYFQKHRDIVKNSKKTMSVEDIENLRTSYEDLEKSKKQTDVIMEDIENLRASYEDLEKSKNLTDVIIEKSPEDFWALNLKGLIFLELAELAKLADHPVLNNKAVLNNKDFITECHNDALEYFNNSILMAEKAKIPFPPPHTGMGHVYYEQNKFFDSFHKYREAIEKGENDAKAYLSKANSLLQFFLGNNNKGIQDKEILQDRVLIRKIKFFPDDYKSVEEVFNAPKNTQKTYAIGFYNDAIKQFKDVGRKRSNVPKSLVQLEEMVEILKEGSIMENKETLKKLIECLDKNNPI
jgi:tetratricopeptide (TPR) repeat protein